MNSENLSLPVSHTGENKHGQREQELLVEEHRNEDRDQHHPKDGKHVGDGDDAGGHELIFNWQLPIVD